MTNFTRIFYGVALTLAVFSTKTTTAQCVFTSTDGYSVTVRVAPISVIAPNSCPNGFNYNLNVSYQVSFSGTNIPSSLYTLQGKIFCGGDENFFSIPLNGGTGTVQSGSNPYRSTTNCASANPGTLNCNMATINIQGSGLNVFNAACPMAGALPVNLVSFNAKIVNGNNVYLKWVTANEISNKTFAVERSTDSRNWQAIKTINGAGNSATDIQYDYTDANLATGMYYYRLKQTDLSGAVSYSNIIGANITAGSTTGISIANVTPTQLYISGLVNYREWQAAVVSTTGAVVSNTVLSSNILPLNGLSAGIYILRLRNTLDGTEKAIKFIKN